MNPEEHMRALLKDLTDIWSLKVSTGDPCHREFELITELDDMRVAYGDAVFAKVCSHLCDGEINPNGPRG